MNKVIPLKWTGPIQDHSGYGSAARDYAGCLLDRPDINLTVSSVSFEKEHTNHGELQSRIQRVLNKQGVPYKIHVVHLTPQNYPAIREQGKYNIAYTVWETNQLPAGWADLCNQMDEVWVPSKWNKEVFEKSGVSKPVFVIPHGIRTPNLNTIKPLSMGVDDDTFVFYSIFQWLARKNPIPLLKAYLTEFKQYEKVCLALKTYRLNTSNQEKDIIKQDIANVKTGLNLSLYPDIRFFGDLLPSNTMMSFHKRGDCFVLASAAEGFGIPYAEAMAFGKPVIGTGYSGNLDFMNQQNSFLIKCSPTPVYNMIFPQYNGNMIWSEPNILHMRKLMRYVFENREQAKQIGFKAREDIEKQLSWNTISDIIVNRLRQIEKGL